MRERLYIQVSGHKTSAVVELEHGISTSFSRDCMP